MKDISELHKQIVGEITEERNKEVESFNKEKEDFGHVKAESEQLKQQLEKEKKIAKDLTTQNVKLNSLVKIGQDALKAEQDRVQELQAQLSLKNGSISSPTLTTANGTSDSVSVNSSNSVGDSLPEVSVFCKPLTYL